MNARRMKIMGFLLIGVCITGCATTSDLLRSKERGRGTTKVYRLNADEAWEIAKTVFRWEQTDAVEEHRSERYMFTSMGESPSSWGVVMGVWIEPVNYDSTRVTVVIKRKNPIDVVVLFTEAAFHEDFELAVRLNAGKSFSTAPQAAESQFIPPEKPTTSMGIALPSSANVVMVTSTFADIRSRAGMIILS